MGRTSMQEQDKLGVQIASDLFRIPLRTLQYWIGTDLISPQEYKRCSGCPTVLSPWDLLAIGVICELRSKGATLQAVRQAVKYLKKMGSQIYERKLVVTEEDIRDYGSLAKLNEEEKTKIISLVEQQGQMFFVDLGKIRQKINRELKKKRGIKVSLI